MANMANAFTWDPALYLQYADERTRPAQDLVTRVPLQNAPRIVDIGCGPGNSTAMLRRRWPEAQIVGLDSSAEMLAEARRRDPTGTWVQHDVARWRAEEPFDLVFSNATLQWVPDHETLLPHLLAQARPGGCLAVQMPAYFESPLHLAMRRIAGLPQWKDRTAGALGRLAVAVPSVYYDLLAPLSARLDLWVTDYIHVLRDAEAIVEWIKSTGARPYLDALETDADCGRFMDLLLASVREAYPPRPDGKVLFTFRRLFFVAERRSR